MSILPFALCAYSLPHVMGYLPTRDGDRISTPLSAEGLLEAASKFELAGAEFPLSTVVSSFDGAQVSVAEPKRDIGEILRDRHLRLVADYGALLDHEADHLREYLKLAANTGAKVVRVTLSHILCGDRRQFPGGWEAHLDALAQRLREVLPFAETLGIVLAVENHQDATSQDLLRLREMTGDSPAFGVTLDTGNPLAVGEDCVEFARRIAPLIRHLHLKDYTVHFAPEGYRLARCAAGDGVVDFKAILEIVRRNGHDLLPAIEIAAQATRTIPLLEADWWAHYPPNRVENLLPVLRVLWDRARPQKESYSSAWERGAESPVVAEEEWGVVRRSVVYLRRLLEDMNSRNQADDWLNAEAQR